MAKATPDTSSQIVFTPGDAATLGLQLGKRNAEFARAGLSVPLPIKYLEDYFAPLLPGNLCVVMAQTSNGKTTFMQFWADAIARGLVDEWREGDFGKGDKKPVVVYISSEDYIEELTALAIASRVPDLGAYDVYSGAFDGVADEAVARAAVAVGALPVIRIGRSVMAETKRPITMAAIVQALEGIQSGALGYKPRIAAVFVDYLQAIEYEDGGYMPDRVTKIRRDIFALRDIAGFFKTPVVAGAQAKQELKGANPPIFLPGTYDAKGASEIAERPDRLLSLWMPIRNHACCTTVQYGNMEFKVSPNMLWVKVLKQRGRLPAGKTFPMLIDFDTNTIYPDERFFQ